MLWKVSGIGVEEEVDVRGDHRPCRSLRRIASSSSRSARWLKLAFPNPGISPPLKGLSRQGGQLAGAAATGEAAADGLVDHLPERLALAVHLVFEARDDVGIERQRGPLLHQGVWVPAGEGVKMRVAVRGLPG